eukprot:jgi/Botrbrau1/7511/Bobra.0019s0002.1
MHCLRLLNSLKTIIIDLYSEDLAVMTPTSASELTRAVLDEVRRARETLCQSCPGELMIVVHAHTEPQRDSGSQSLPIKVGVYAKVFCISWFLSQPLTVQLVNQTRRLADCKDSTWATCRTPLQSKFAKDVQEGLLVDEESAVQEGLVSNFFVVKATNDGEIVQTSPAGGQYPRILDGVMRRLVLEECSSLGLHVQLSAPNLSCVTEWTEAFTSNSVQGIRAVGVIRGYSGSLLASLPSAPGPVFLKLQEGWPGVMDKYNISV